jgi:para-nitrobenzyl esterase
VLLEENRMTDIVVDTNAGLTPLAGDRPQNAAVGALISEAFVQFARTGDPNHGGLPSWDPYTLEHRATMQLDATPRAVTDPRPAIRELYARVASTT